MSGFGMTLSHYIRRGLAYRWVVLVPAVVVFAIVTVYLTLQPDTFESTATLGSPLSRSGDPAMRAEADASAREALRSAQQRFLSTAMLTRVAEEINPYPALQAELGTEGVVDRLRKRLVIEVDHGANTISVSCSHNEGEKPAEMAANVVNSLVENFVTHLREQMGDTSARYKRSLDRSKKEWLEKLNRAENELNEFKRVNQNCLPEDVEANRAAIRDLNAQVAEYLRAQKDARDALRSLDSEQFRLQQMLDADSSAETSTSDVIRGAEAYVRRLEEEMTGLRARYTQESPEVMELRKKIELATARLDDLKKSSNDRGEGARRLEMLNFMVADVAQRKADANATITQLDEFIAARNKEIEETNQRIVKAGTLLNPLNALLRAADECNTQYRDVARRLASLDQVGSASADAPAIPIEVLQRAWPSPKPASPDRLAGSLIGLALGAGIGVGLAVARTKVDTSYRRAEDLRALLPGAVLVTIPEVTGTGARVSRALTGVASGLLLFAIFSATVALLGSQLGWWEAPQLVQAVLNLKR